MQHYPYVGADNRLDVDGMLAALQQVPPGDVVLLHACCHNPTGFDLSQDDWLRVLDIVRRRELLPLFDFATRASAMAWTRTPGRCGCSPRRCRSC